MNHQDLTKFGTTNGLRAEELGSILGRFSDEKPFHLILLDQRLERNPNFGYKDVGSVQWCLGPV